MNMHRLLHLLCYFLLVVVDAAASAGCYSTLYEKHVLLIFNSQAVILKYTRCRGLFLKMSFICVFLHASNRFFLICRSGEIRQVNLIVHGFSPILIF